MKKVFYSVSFLASICCVIWSMAFVFIKMGLEYTEPIQFGGIRFFFSGLVLLPFCGGFRNYIKFFLKNYKLICYVAVCCTFLSYALFYVGIDKVSSALTAILIGSSPLFTAIISHFLSGNDKMGLGKFLSIAFGILGVTLISVEKLFNTNNGNTEFIGVVILLLHVVMISFSNVVVSKYTKGIPAVILNSSQLIIGGLGLVVLSLFFEEFSFSAFIEPNYYISLFFLVMFAAVTMSIWFGILQRKNVKVSDLNLWKFIIPVLGAILGWSFMPNESPTLIAIIGMLVISSSLVALSLYNKYKNKKGNRVIY